MYNKKFSLESAYSSGSKVVFNYFFFFFATIVISLLACAAYLAVLGVIDFFALRHHAAALLNMFQHVFTEPTGPLHYGGTSISEAIRAHLPADIANQITSPDVVSFDVSGYEWGYIFSWLIPTALVFKLFLDLISIGWTKIALDLDSRKHVSLSYIFKYYHFVPRVFCVNLIVGFLTILGALLFILPGIFVYERLRFARYFIIDKNFDMMKALRASWNLTDGSVIHLFGFTLISIIVKSLGQLLILANLFTIPLQNQVEADVYRQMVSSK
ncbi:MAG TPA: hypothetical protein VLG50_08895 [Candidatus Saccharimonadales bacterium]|nr:hypothetical protein [Candidatus Saccharimonadales bacterium]